MKEVGTGGQNAYGYDGDGRRVRKNENGGANLYSIWSTVLGKVAFEAMQGNSGTRVYLYAGKQQVAVRGSDRGFYWSHTDHLGSLKKLTRTNGTVAYRAEYDPHGQRLLEWSDVSTGLNTHKFTGHEFDAATGLEYANARMYTHNRGRFMQPDRLALGAARATHPQSLNRYTYVSNDPINLVDRNGLQDELPDAGTVFRDTTSAPYPQPPVPIGPHDFFDGVYQPDEGGIVIDPGGGQDPRVLTAKRLLEDALSILKVNEKCRKLLDSTLEDLGEYKSAGVLLETIMGNNQFEVANSEGKPATMSGVGGDATLILRSTFFSIGPDQKIILIDGTKKIEVTLAQMQLVSILHELAHGTGRYTHEKDRVGKPYQELIDNDKLNWEVFDTCVKAK